jgi:hypothetical protein
MRGFPKHLNSKQDFQNCLAEYPEETKAEIKRLLENRFIWQDVAIVDDEECCDDTHRVVETDDEKIQQELVEDKNAELFRLGFTVEEAEELIK